MLKRPTFVTTVLLLMAGCAMGAAPVSPQLQSPVINGTLTVGGITTPAVRQVLQAATTYYVNANSSSTATCGVSGTLTCQPGSDSNNGTSNATPFLTLNHAYQTIANTADLAGQAVTINLAHGSSNNYMLFCNNGPFLGNQPVLVTGDSAAPTAVTIVDNANGYGVIAEPGCSISVTNLAFADAGAGTAAGHIVVTGGGNLVYSGITFGGMTGGGTTSAIQMSILGQGSITANGSLTITSSAPTMLGVIGPGSMNFKSQHVTISTGSLNYANAVAEMADGGEINALTTTFNGAGVGTLTGARCQVFGPAMTNGFDPNAIFPGNSSCLQNVFQGAMFVSGVTLASLGPCNGGETGVIAHITDSTTVTWGATITGSGANDVLGYCNGSAWTVFAK